MATQWQPHETVTIKVNKNGMEIIFLSFINHFKFTIIVFCLLSYLTDIISDFVNAVPDKAGITNPKLYNFNLS